MVASSFKLIFVSNQNVLFRLTESPSILTDPIHMGLKHKLPVILGFRMTPQ